ncbi:cytoplasm protein [Cutaneotrichosporon oleaginosum]|uniref:gluconokinase n=1 Tax=Cutaneotrichosporon oleaginosum TaxID=879819 RepID=A0A0J0XW13_9TREE|nr:cytoplasm protein [Cutaneotrichosporon oleaginosum]KLT45285.1 cytoplasm protein [Cutaneotrichosporon oleaginosum]
MDDYASTKPLLIVVMGPASCGKSTIGANLARDLGIAFIDGDALHPPANVAKMSAGNPLNDADRLPWLQIIRATGIHECRAAWEKGDGRVPDQERAEGKLGRPACVIACSALKKSYRDILRGHTETGPEDKPVMKTIFVYCNGSPELLAERIAARQGHFMKPQMLASQLATLEDPTAEPGVVDVDISATPEEVSSRALSGTRKVVADMDSRGE